MPYETRHMDNAGMRSQDPGDKQDGFWDLYSTFYDSLYHLMSYRSLLWDTYEALDLEPGMRVLDAGCGTGNLEVFIAEKDPVPVSIDAIDFSRDMLAKARMKCAELDNVRFSRCDLNDDLPFPDDSFDRIASVNVLYTLPNVSRTLREFLRVLRPEGKMVLASPLPSFHAPPLVADHFGRVRNIWGFGRKARVVLTSIAVLSTTALGSIALNALVIIRREKAGRYHRLDQHEMRTLLENHAEAGVANFRIVPAMADQDFLATATKSSRVVGGV